jgi:hypothetical protein
MKRATPALALALSLVALGLPITDQVASAQPGSTYQIRVTNLTPRQSFTPLLAATHTPDASIFLPGTFASDALKALAEGGDVAPLTAWLNGMPMSVMGVVSGSGLTTPGVTTVLSVMGGGPYNRLSIVSMLIPTNDTFVGVNTTLPMTYEPKVVYAYAYDGGTEVNDETCASIPGPDYPECGGPGSGGAPGNGEGAIVISSGIKGIGDFGVDRDWKNPVARITIEKMKP